MINMIVSQGRVADRISGLIEGAAYCAQSIHKRLNIKPQFFGTPSEAVNDDWSESLIKAKDTLNAISLATEKSILSRKMTLLLSNTCSVSLATLPKVVQHIPDIKILWIDAHTDFNTPETTDSGYLGGMVVAGTFGLWDSGYGNGVTHQNILYLGVRDIDKEEMTLLEKHKVNRLSPKDCDIDKILQFIDDSPVWIHIDWDVLEPGYLPADYEIPDGLEPVKIAEILNSIPIENLYGIELAEYCLSSSEEQNKRSEEIFYSMLEDFIIKKMTLNHNLKME